MIIKNENLRNYKALITLNSNYFNPEFTDFGEDESFFQAKLDGDRRASEVLGMDFLMFAEGGLFAENKKLKKATGIFNFAQAITHRLMTTRGTMPGDPFFGVPWGKYLGATYVNKNFLINSLIDDVDEELEKDFRVGRILNIDASFINPNTISLNVSIIPIYTSFSDTVNILITAGV